MPDSTEPQETIQWMSMEEVEKQLTREDSSDLQRAFVRVREEVAPKIAEHRRQEAADYADAEHQIVGYEPIR